MKGWGWLFETTINHTDYEPHSYVSCLLLRTLLQDGVTPMQDEYEPKIYTEPDFEAYRNFFSLDRCESILDMVKDKRKLYEIVFDLIADWKSVAYTASLPFTTLEMMEIYHNAFVNSETPNSTLIRLTDALRTKLVHEMPDELTVDPSVSRRIQASLIKTCVEIKELWVTTEFEFSKEDHWNSYTENRQFQLGLWGSQRICYVSIYNAYNNFVGRIINTLRISKGEKLIWTTDKKLKNTFIDLFNEELFYHCWSKDNEELHTARLARHALSHSGGSDEKLNERDHDFQIVDGKIHVTPKNTKALYSLLTKCVSKLSEKAVTMHGFD